MHDIYPFGGLSSSPSHFDSFTWMIWLLGVGSYLVIGGSFIWAPGCYFLLGRARLEEISGQLDTRLTKCHFSGIAVIAAVYAFESTLSLMATPGRVLSIVFSVLFWAALVLGYSGLALWVTSRARGEPASIAWVAAGAGLITILQVMPIVGGLFLVWFCLISLGAVAVAVSRVARGQSAQLARRDEPSQS